MSQSSRSVSTTFSRGLDLIELLSRSSQPRSVADISGELNLSRTVVYRLLQTLDEHGLLAQRADDGKVMLGFGLLSWSRNVEDQVRQIAMPILRQLAEATGGTAFVGALEGDDVVCLASAQPIAAIITARYREGIRTPATRGASGVAVRSITEGTALEPGGYAVSRQEVESNSAAIAAPVRTLSWPGALTVIFPMVDADLARHSESLLRARDALEQQTGSTRRGASPSTPELVV